MPLPTGTHARVFVFVLTISLLFFAATVLYGPLDRLRKIYSYNFNYNNNTIDEKSPLASDQQILLVTYGRSGSTFTSDIIRHSQDVFYVYEPLSILQRLEEASLRKADVPKYWINDKKEKSLRIIEAFLTCNFELVALETLNNAHLKQSESTEQFYHCMQTLDKGSSHLQCFFDLFRQCRAHKMTFTKTIRLRPRWAEYLIYKYPSLKLIYLVRDPRATLYSQAKVFHKFSFQDDIKNVSASHCSRLGEDLEAVRLLQERFPGRVKAMRYEHGAMDPLGYTADIYRFLGLPLTSAITDYVKSLTTPKDLGTDHTDRQDSSQVKKHEELKEKLPGLKRKSDQTHFLQQDNTNAKKVSLNGGRATEDNGRLQSRQAAENLRWPRETGNKETLGPLRRGVKSEAYSTHRDNPLSVMQHWRYEAGIKAVRAVDAQCSHLYRTLGYRIVTNQAQLENTDTIDLVVSPESDGVFGDSESWGG